jgi:LysR family hydrogen peroxide-inducible transcriptional activator
MGLIIHEDFTSRLREKLKRGDLDAIFIALPFTEPSVVVKPLYEEPFMLLLPKDHELVKKEAIEKNDLKKEKTLLLGVGHCFRDQILKDFPQCYNPDDAQQTVEGASLETLRHMVASGLGVTILPSTATQIKHYSTTLCVRPFKGSVPKRVIALAWRASFPRTQAIDALIKAFEKAKLSMTCPIG